MHPSSQRHLIFSLSLSHVWFRNIGGAYGVRDSPPNTTAGKKSPTKTEQAVKHTDKHARDAEKNKTSTNLNTTEPTDMNVTEI